MPVDRHRETLEAFVSPFLLAKQPIFWTKTNKYDKGKLRNSFRPFAHLPVRKIIRRDSRRLD
ncbi:uncharacterized protein G2W53_038403 [Senna tora]|uniref:Uncharacterized protein n=1 Tax=Senna tora TaxID=362788 RepID=A0A834W1W8_9FABA|nr:uncharacterized protein G2W53_038403 [Senna tora]